MKTVTLVVAFTTLGVGLATTAHAGQRFPQQNVGIDSTRQTVQATISNARGSSDSVQEAECRVEAFDDGSGRPPHVSCLPIDAPARQASCTRTSPGFVQVAAALQSST